MNAALLLPLAAAVAGGALAACVLWPLRRRGTAGFAAACLSVAVAAAGLYLLVGTPHAAQAPAAADAATLRDGIRALEQSLQRDPQRAEGWVLLGRARGELGQAAAAADAFAQALALAPDDPARLVDAAQARAQADAGKRFDDTALGWLQHALAVQPDAERAAWLLGIALRQRGRDAEAVEVWSALLPRLQPGAATALREQIAIARSARPDGVATAGVEAAARPAASLRVRIAVPSGFAASDWPPQAALFVLARVPGGASMPVAVRRYPLDALPTQVTLGDSDSPMPTRPLSAHARVEVLARLSRDGSAGPGEGDLQSDPVIVELPAQAEPVLRLH